MRNIEPTTAPLGEALEWLTEIEKSSGVWEGFLLGADQFTPSLLSNQLLLGPALLFSEARKLNEISPLVHSHVLFCARNPDPGSSFSKAYQTVAHLPDDLLIETLLGAGYDCLLHLGSQRAKVCAHQFFQIKGETLHHFSRWVLPTMRGSGMSFAATLDLLEFARAKSLQKVILGNIELRDGFLIKGHPSTLGLLKKLVCLQQELGISVTTFENGGAISLSPCPVALNSNFAPQTQPSAT